MLNMRLLASLFLGLSLAACGDGDDPLNDSGSGPGDDDGVQIAFFESVGGAHMHFLPLVVVKETSNGYYIASFHLTCDELEPSASDISSLAVHSENQSLGEQTVDGLWTASGNGVGGSCSFETRYRLTNAGLQVEGEFGVGEGSPVSIVMTEVDQARAIEVLRARGFIDEYQTDDFSRDYHDEVCIELFGNVCGLVL